MEEKIYKVVSPLTIQYGSYKDGKPKIFSLNLNIYRNTHRFTLNSAKEAYTDLMLPLVKNLPVFSKVKLTYVLFTGSKRLVDVMNICCIVDKFFCDVLTKANRLPDDNYDFLPEIEFKFGGIDKQNPRVEIHIKEIL